MKTILVVEDDPKNMKLTVDLLELNGVDVLKAVDGESALKILKDSIPDLILLDIRLPGIDGYEVYRKVRQDKRLDNVKVVALTASVLKEAQERIEELGFDACISKPIDTKEFVAKIKGMLGVA